MTLLRNITNENFEAMASAFSNLNDGICSILSLEPWVHSGIEKPATIGPWMAWRDYRISKRLSIRFMDHMAKSNKRWTVPALWPHEFDADRSVADDMKIESHYRANPFKEKPRDHNISEDERKAFVRRITRAS